MPYEKRIRYGEPDVLNDEVFVVQAATRDEHGPGYRSEPYVLLLDLDTGEEWTLTANQADALAAALRSCAKAIS